MASSSQSGSTIRLEVPRPNPYQGPTASRGSVRRAQFPIATSPPPANFESVAPAVVLVVAAPPQAGLVATERRAVEPWIHAPEGVYPSLVCRVGLVDQAILQRERAHAGPLSPVGRPVRSDQRRELSDEGILLSLWHPEVNCAEVVLDGTRPPLLLCVRHMEVVVEVAAERRRPGEAPAHPLLVRLQLRKRSPRHNVERDVVIG